MKSLCVALVAVISTSCSAPPCATDSDGGAAGGSATSGGAAGGGAAGGGAVGGGATGGGATGGGMAVDAGTPLRIDSIAPQTVVAGEQIAVLGAGLDARAVQSLRFDDTQVPVAAIKPGSSDRLLLINTPPLFNVPQTGKLVTLSITTGLGTVQGTYTQLPGVPSFLQTATSLTPRGVSPGGAVQPNTNYTLAIEVKLAANRAEVFDLIADVDGAGFSIVDVVPGTITIPASSGGNPVVTPVNVTVRAGASGIGEVGLKVRPRSVPRDGSILVPRIALEVSSTPASLDGVLFGDLSLFGPHDLDVSNFVPVVRVLSANAATNPIVRLMIDVGSPADGGTLAVTDLTAPAGWNPVASGPIQTTAGVLAPLSITFTPTVADGGFAVPNGEFSFTVQDTSSVSTRPFRGMVQVVR